MKRTLLSGAALLALILAVPALAADMPAPAPVTKGPVVAPVFNWSGLYAGVMAGYGWGEGNASSTLSGGTSVDVDGWFAGGQIGFNYQAPGSTFVWGVELDSAWADISGDSPVPAGTTTTSSDYFGTLRLRAGVAVDQTLFYLTGGLAWAHNDLSVSIIVPASASDSNTHVGWTIGAGVEQAVAPNWSVKLEYLYTDLGHETYTLNFGGGLVDVVSAGSETHTVKLGLNYRFGY